MICARSVIVDPTGCLGLLHSSISCVLSIKPVAIEPFLHMSASVIKRILHPILPRGVRVIHVYSPCRSAKQHKHNEKNCFVCLWKCTSRIPEVCKVCCSFETGPAVASGQQKSKTRATIREGAEASNTPVTKNRLTSKKLFQNNSV